MATLSYTVNAIDGASGTFAKIAVSADDLNHKIDELGRKSAMAKVGLEGDKQAQASLKDLDLKLTKLKTKTADPNVTVKGLESAYFGLGRLDVALDKIGAKHVTATVDVKVNRSALNRLAAGGFGLDGGGGAASGGGGLLSSPLGIGAIAGGGAIAAGLVPSVVGLGLGGLAGAGAIGGGLFGAAEGKKQLNADLANIKSITTRLKGAVGEQKTVLSQALKDASKQYQKDSTFFQPFTTFQASIQNLAKTVLAPLRPIMAPLTQLFTQFGKGLTGLGPQFTSLFRASLPFVKQFLDFMLQAGKILLPAFTTALNQMVRSGALKQMTAALVVLTQGLATFIVNLGPGMAASAQIFARLMTFIGRALGFLGDLFTVIAKALAADWSPAHLWNILLDSAKAFFAAVVSSAKAFWHAVAASFDALRHDISAIWDTIWRNTVGRVQRGITDVLNFIRPLPGKIKAFFSAAGTWLLQAGRNVIQGLWNGIKAIWATVSTWFSGSAGRINGFFRGALSWLNAAGRNVIQGLWNGLLFIWNKVKSFISGIAGWIKAHKGPIALDSKLLEPAGRALMKGLHTGLTGGFGLIKDFIGGIGSFFTGHVGSGVAQWAGLVRQALRMEGLSPSLLNNVLYQMQTESGGNPNAINLSDINAQRGDPSKGLMQVIGSTFAAYHWPGTSGNIYNPLANIAAALNYARHVYGPSLMSGGMGIGSGHGYDRGGWLMPGVTMAVNATGSPELVTPNTGPGSMAEVTALLRQLVAATKAAPSRSAAGFARELNGAATRALR